MPLSLKLIAAARRGARRGAVAGFADLVGQSSKGKNDSAKVSSEVWECKLKEFGGRGSEVVGEGKRDEAR